MKKVTKEKSVKAKATPAKVNKAAKPAAKKAAIKVAKTPAKKAEVKAKAAAPKAAPKATKTAVEKVTEKVTNKVVEKVTSVAAKAAKSVKATADLAKKAKDAGSEKLRKVMEANSKETAVMTLKAAMSKTVKPAHQLEPEAVLEAQEQEEVTDQERKALFRKLAQAGTNWENVYKIAKGMKAKNYKMSDAFEAKTPILHKVLGWGFIMSSENNRIQVLFKDGIKTLITNYSSGR